MQFGVEVDGALDETQFDALHILEKRLDRADPRISAHLSSDGVSIVVTTLPTGFAFTAVYRLRGEASALTVTGQDWFHTWAVFAQQLCTIFKVGYWFSRH